MDVDHWMEMAKSLDSREEGKAEELEKLKRMFERFHILNRKYLDKEAFEKAQGSGASIAEAIASRSEERRVGKECRSRWSPYH